MNRVEVIKAIADLKHATAIVLRTWDQLTGIHMCESCRVLQRELEISDEECESYRTSNPTGPLPPL